MTTLQSHITSWQQFSLTQHQSNLKWGQIYKCVFLQKTHLCWRLNMKLILLIFIHVFGTEVIQKEITLSSTLFIHYSSQILVMLVFRGQNLTCHRSEYQTGSECCPMCPVGKILLNRCFTLVKYGVFIYIARCQQCLPEWTISVLLSQVKCIGD